MSPSHHHLTMDLNHDLTGTVDMAEAQQALLKALRSLISDQPQASVGIAMRPSDISDVLVGTPESDTLVSDVEIPVSSVTGDGSCLPCEGIADGWIVPFSALTGAERVLVGGLVLVLPNGMSEELRVTFEKVTAMFALFYWGWLMYGRTTAVMRYSHDIMVPINQHGNMLFAPKLAPFIGVSPDSVLGARVYDFLEPESAELIESFVKDGEPGESHVANVRWLHADGTVRHTETTVSKLPDSLGTSRWIMSSRDISDRIALEVELRRSQQLESIGRLAAGMAHEINTPLQAISNNVLFMQDGISYLVGTLSADGVAESPTPSTKPAPTQDEELTYLIGELPSSIEDTTRCLERIATIVASMKAFGRPDITTPETIDVQSLVASAVEVAATQIDSSVNIDNQANAGTVGCVVGDMGQVIYHLIINADHAIKDASRQQDGVIKIESKLAADGVQISITDNGCGIPEENFSKIFNLFYTTKEVGQGTGQGLALCQAVVESHGGSISLESKIDVGTTFHIWLPAA